MPSNRDEAMRILNDAIAADAQWLSNRRLRDACYEAIALLGDEPKSPEHKREFYANGSFCKKCGVAIGSGYACK